MSWLHACCVATYAASQFICALYTFRELFTYSYLRSWSQSGKPWTSAIEPRKSKQSTSQVVSLLVCLFWLFLWRLCSTERTRLDIYITVIARVAGDLWWRKQTLSLGFALKLGSFLAINPWYPCHNYYIQSPHFLVFLHYSQGYWKINHPHELLCYYLPLQVQRMFTYLHKKSKGLSLSHDITENFRQAQVPFYCRNNRWN